jgi:hypothetical protein
MRKSVRQAAVSGALLVGVTGVVSFSAAGASGTAAKSDGWKIQNAMSAAPAAVSKSATILDFPKAEGAVMATLRAGSNGWTCLPDDPHTAVNDPICMDKQAAAFFGAWMAHKQPETSGAGLAYMLQGGTTPSNTDPFATKPVAGHKATTVGPHIMVTPAGTLGPGAYTTDPDKGVPWVMWGGSPYAHFMMPVK